MEEIAARRPRTDPERADRAIPPIVKALGAVSFFNDIASEMVYPLLPAFFTQTMGVGAVALGALDGISDAVSAGVKLLAGRLGDRRRWRRPLVVGGYALASVARPMMALSGAAWHVIALRAVDRVGKGVRSPARDAVIADATHPSIRGKAFGFHRAMDHAGAMIGPLIAAGLIWLAAASPRDVILWSAVPGAIAIPSVWFALRREAAVRTSPGTGVQPDTEPRSAVRGGLVGLVVLFAFARFPEALFLLRLQDVGVPLAAVPLLWAALHLVRAAATYPGGVLSDRIGPMRAMAAGWMVYAVVCAGLAFAGSALSAAVWFLAFGLVAAATEAPERALVAAWGGTLLRSRRYGIYHAGTGAAALPGALVFGAVYATAGGTTALFVPRTSGTEPPRAHCGSHPDPSEYSALRVRHLDSRYRHRHLGCRNCPLSGRRGGPRARARSVRQPSRVPRLGRTHRADVPP